MTKVIFHAYNATRENGFTSIAITETCHTLLPETVDAPNLDAIKTAFLAYKLKAIATGKGLVISAMLGRGEKAPRGFRKWEATFVPVNL